MCTLERKIWIHAVCIFLLLNFSACKQNQDKSDNSHTEETQLVAVQVDSNTNNVQDAHASEPEDASENSHEIEMVADLQENSIETAAADAEKEEAEAQTQNSGVLTLEQLKTVAESDLHNAPNVIRYIEALMGEKQYSEVRTFYSRLPYAVRALPQMRTLYYQAFNEDALFTQDVETISGAQLDEISPLGGGTTLTFKFIKNGEKLGAFKPHQKRRNSNYRSEIAAWRLCELLQCDFRIPRNQMVRVEKNEFNRLYNLSKSPKREYYRKGFDDLIWTPIKSRSYVYGTLKDWVPDFTSFPIEFAVMWRDWVGQAKYMDTFPALSDALAPIKKHENIRDFFDLLMAQAGNMTTRDLANQISQMLTFDYLIGNWDRFSVLPEQRGRNCQFKDGHLVSIDNGASFVAVDMKYIVVRFKYIERFNRRFVEELRMLDMEETFKILFPTQSKIDRSNFAEFWQRRTEVLNRIDTLIAEYGEDKVLSF